MPDAPISTTLTLELGQWASSANPGNTALNEQWEKIDAAVLAHGDSFPTSYQPLKLFLRDDMAVIFRNDNTLEAPAWTPIMDVASLADALDDKAEQGDLDALDVRVTATEADITTLQTNDYLKRDGSDPMTGDLDMDGHNINGLPAPTVGDQAATKDYVDDILTAGLAGLGTAVSCRVSRTNALNLGAGGGYVTWEAEVADHGGMVDIVGHNTRLTIPQSGAYVFIFNIGTNVATASLQLRKNGNAVTLLDFVTVDYLASAYGHTGSNPFGCFGPYDLAAGDYVEFFIHADNGDGSLQVCPVGIPNGSIFAGGFLVASNAAGGGDLKSNGTIPMTAPFNNGGQKSSNAADGVANDDLATVGQVADGDDLLQAQIDAIEDEVDGLGGMGVLQAPETEVATPSLTFSFGTSWSEFTQSRLEFTLAAGKRVVIEAEATAGPDFLQRSDAQLGIRIQALDGPGGSPVGSPVDVKGTLVYSATLGERITAPIGCKTRKTLAAGTWRVSIICRRAGTSNSAFIYASDDYPARIGATYIG